MDRELEERLRSFAGRRARPGELSERVLHRYRRTGRAAPDAARPAPRAAHGGVALAVVATCAVLLIALAVVPILEGRLRPAGPWEATPTRMISDLPVVLTRPAHQFSLPSGCSYMGGVNVIADGWHEWRIDCGPERNRNARETLGRALEQQGWRLCAVGLGTARWFLDDPRGRGTPWTSSVAETAGGEPMRLIQRQAADWC